MFSWNGNYSLNQDILQLNISGKLEFQVSSNACQNCEIKYCEIEYMMKFTSESKSTDIMAALLPVNIPLFSHLPER